MKLINYFNRVLKQLITTIGIIFVYLLGFSIGKLFYFFSPAKNHKRWSQFQSGTGSCRMF